MKQTSFSAPFSIRVFLRLAICAVLVASANPSAHAREANSSNQSGAIFATSAADGGRLVIKRSPLLGLNIAISLMIDGKVAGTLVRGQVYDRYLTPGRHILTASCSGSGQPWQGTLDVRPGETYSYSASYNVNRLVLTPLTGSR
jgi:hypothetical protein